MCRRLQRPESHAYVLMHRDCEWNLCRFHMPLTILVSHPHPSGPASGFGSVATLTGTPNDSSQRVKTSIGFSEEPEFLQTTAPRISRTRPSITQGTLGICSAVSLPCQLAFRPRTAEESSCHSRSVSSLALKVSYEVRLICRRVLSRAVWSVLETH